MNNTFKLVKVPLFVMRIMYCLQLYHVTYEMRLADQAIGDIKAQPCTEHSG